MIIVFSVNFFGSFDILSRVGVENLADVRVIFFGLIFIELGRRRKIREFWKSKDPDCLLQAKLYHSDVPYHETFHLLKKGGWNKSEGLKRGSKKH